MQQRDRDSALSKVWQVLGRLFPSASVLLWALVTFSAAIGAQEPAALPPLQYGPYNANFLPGGTGLRYPVKAAQDTLLLANSRWTISAWFNASDPIQGLEFLAGLGDVTSEYPRLLAVVPGQIVFWMGQGNQLTAPAQFAPHQWHLISAVFDGESVSLYNDGRLAAKHALIMGPASAVLVMGPPLLVPEQRVHYGGKIAGFTVLRHSVSAAEAQQMFATPPDFGVLSFEEGSKPWPVQTRGQAGYDAPQDPQTLPVSRASFSAPQVLKRPPVGESLVASKSGEWTFADGWTLSAAPQVHAVPQVIGSTSFSDVDWMRATVPGTVLTTMIDDGIYPDPAYGLNNLAIPESLNRQEYWYRNTFTVPAEMRPALAAGGHRVLLTFGGINYSAEIWLNGDRLGTIRGAFQRGQYDVSALLRPGERNVLAVRIAPPPHPGIPNEQSVLGGSGENGGLMELDGPTFLATEGWDWIPAVRDRDSGIWQPVTLTMTRELRVGDVQVLTSFAHHDTSRAALELRVPVINPTKSPMQAKVSATVDAVAVHKTVQVLPGENVVVLAATEFPQLNLQHPRLWWPNGYGKPELYTAHVTVASGADGDVSDTKDVRFGVREISYELSLLDATGHLRRVEFTPGAAVGADQPIVDVSHDGMRQIPSADAMALHVPEAQRDEYKYQTVVSSLPPSAESSPAIEPSSDNGPAPYLVIKVNGVRIAARGGNWGMDDFRKRVSREHLEPFFRLHRDAHLNMIRNWVGQSTEDAFFDLADEYGLLVWNDFWESTQNYNIEAQDPGLFLDNAHDVIQRYRNHPSIVLWCGRNEGVPQPILNTGLEALVRTLDGTRFYSPSSNQINLQQSGPYSYQNPADYATTLNRGFSVETGTPSMSTLESFQSSTPVPDQWPIDDVWAYHDWHQAGDGRVAPFMAELEAEFGAATSLADFERKAQMLNYVDHRAIFEGMNANLWQPNSGRLLWMSQPAWPSTMWQILSSDYDTQASFYGTKKACEPLHVQLNLSTGEVNILNTTREARSGLLVSAEVYSLTNTLLFKDRAMRSAAADDKTLGLMLDLTSLLSKGLVLVRLQLADATGAVLSNNLYWLAGQPAQYRTLTTLASATMGLTASTVRQGEELKATVRLTNLSHIVSIENKLTLMRSDHQRILPAYYSDNYISLLPGETETVEIRYPATPANAKASIGLRGWNAAPQTVAAGQ